MDIRTKVLINKKTKQLSIMLKKKQIKEKLKGKLPKYVNVKLERFEF